MQATSPNPISPHQDPAGEPPCFAPPRAGWHGRMLERRFQTILTPIFLKFDGCLTGAICRIPNVYAGPDGLTAPTPQRAPLHPWHENFSVPFPSVVAPFDPPRWHPGTPRFYLHPNQSEVIRGNPRQSEVPRGDDPPSSVVGRNWSRDFSPLPHLSTDGVGVRPFTRRKNDGNDHPDLI